MRRSQPTPPSVRTVASFAFAASMALASALVLSIVLARSLLSLADGKTALAASCRPDLFSGWGQPEIHTLSVLELLIWDLVAGAWECALLFIRLLPEETLSDKILDLDGLREVAYSRDRCRVGIRSCLRCSREEMSLVADKSLVG